MVRENYCRSSRTSKTWCTAHSFSRSIADSNRSRSFSLRTSWLWCVTKRSRFIISRFPTLSRFTWFLRFSRCFCFRMRDRLADSRFDIIRLRFRSSITEAGWVGSSEPDGWFGSSGQELELVLFLFGWFGSSEPELEITDFGFEWSEPELDITGSWGLRGKKAGSCC